ncbi:ribosome-associated translation inhibitor RaiA [Candidatus Nomurabacteria bacterium]|nr:ribosome-associated translation inhibitor RaiA [Candidatus Nomurabacteria bacterium]
MNYAIKGTDLAITAEIRSYVEKRLGGMDKFAPTTSRVDVEVAYEAQYDGPQYRAECMYHEPGEELVRTEARGTTLHEAIDLASGELTRTVGARKKKNLQVVRRAAVKVKEYLRGWRDSI